MRLIPALLVAVTSLGLMVPVPAAAQEVIPERRVVLDQDTDLPGGDLQQLFNTTAEACVATCLATTGCQALTYNTVARSCFPKGEGAGQPQPFAGALSGRVVLADPRARAAEAERLAGAESWLTADDRAAAREQAATLGTLYPGTGEPAEVLRARAAAEAAADVKSEAIRWMGAVTAMTDDPSDWLSLAQWMSAKAQADNDTAAESRAAMNAAVNSWLRDPGVGALALRVWAYHAVRRDRGRDAMRALRIAQAAGADPELQALLDKYEARFGLRAEETSVDADAPQPRACVTMSEEMAPGTDYRSFVALPDPALAVEAEGRQICVSGLTHGQELKLTLRKGLPAASGETLQRDVPQTIYVRDRSPQARFAGRAYLLPAGGDQGLTVQTVNTDRVALSLYRMSDRNIVRALRQEIFGQPLSEWKAETFTDDLGEQIWQGEADVARSAEGAAKVNEEVATRLDIARAAGPLTPGVYALTAAVPGQSEDRSPAATQWFMISDLGLSTWSGTDGLTVAVRGLSDAAARAGVRVQLVSRGNAVLGEALTDAEGVARFEAGLTRGRDAAAPAMITAAVMGKGATELSAPADMAFLSLVEPEFDLSDRGVEGQPPAPPIDLFATTDRGAYRAGEVVHATILARDDKVAALPDMPLTAVILRPDGVEATRYLVPAAGDGGYVLDWQIPDTAPRGSWRIDLKVEADGPTLTSLRVLVEDFRPERLDLALSLPPAPLRTDAPLDLAADARWLYGAPGAELPIEGELRIAAAAAVPGWEGYQFGRYDAQDEADVVTLDPGLTDAAGRWSAEVPVPPALLEARRPLEATVVLNVREGAGRPVERREARLVLPRTPAIGIKPGFDGAVPEGSEASFQIVALNPAVQPVAAAARWRLNKVSTDYQWYAMRGDWSWEPVTTRARVAAGELPLVAGQPTPLTVAVDWGEFELVVTTPEGAESAIRFSAGWGAAGAGSDTPDRLRVSLDKPAYRPGETATATLEAAADGVALVSVMSNRLISMKSVPVRAGENRVDLPVTDDWGAGVYVAVSAIRPLSADAGHAPIRAMGLAHAAVDPGARLLQASIEAPAETLPRGEARVRLRVDGAARGETVHATLAAVDQGILNLTAFKSPDPAGHYFGQRRLGVGLRDVYGRLILPSGAADGAIRSGGSDAGPQESAPPPTEKLMAFFSGPLTVGADGTVEVAVPLPDFNGEVRLMAVVWTAKAVGQAEAKMLVRDPVVMTVTAPAFLAPGDESEVALALTHVSGPAGTVGLGAESQGDPALGLADLPAEVTLADKGRGSAALRIIAPQTEGVSRLRLTATLPDGSAVTKDLAITIARQDPRVTRATRLTLSPGETASLDPATLGPFLPGTGHATLTSGAFAQLDLGAALLRLATYPYGCTEQLASRAMPQLYLAELAGGIDLPGADGVQVNVNKAIAEILTRQAPSGGFGLWDAGTGDLWLAAYTTDFLSRARTAGYAVPDEPFRRAMTHLQNRLNNASEPQFGESDENAALAYAAYVLAREHAAVISDLRYYVDTAGDSFATPMAAAQLGAALAAYGDVGRADAMFRRVQRMLARGVTDNPARLRGDYGTTMRDAAGALALAAEAGTQAVDKVGVARAVSALIAEREAKGGGLSTQEALWSVLAGHALSAGPNAGAGLSIGGAPAAGPVVRLGDPAAMAPVALTNSGPAPLDVTLSVTAAPADPPPAGGTAWGITRRYFTPEGEAVDPAQIAIGTRLVAVLEIRPLSPGGGRLIVTDPLPAGFEIDNPNLIAAGELSGLDWLEGQVTDPEMAQFRQDRFAAAVDWTKDESFTLAYRLRVVSPGLFAHPAATVEDMYRPERRGWTDSSRVSVTR